MKALRKASVVDRSWQRKRARLSTSFIRFVASSTACFTNVASRSAAVSRSSAFHLLWFRNQSPTGFCGLETSRLLVSAKPVRLVSQTSQRLVSSRTGFANQSSTV
nr:hypothetical protein Iba_chr03aCG6940 [Ipomoea batatas]